MTTLTLEHVARIAHEANRTYAEIHGDKTHLPWAEAPAWQREAAIKGVEQIVELGSTTPEDAHAAWSDEKLRQGWVYGPIKDPTLKTHPCLVPWQELSEADRKKDRLFIAVVTALLE